MCLFEGVLEKLSKSKYSKNFILKDDLLISSLIGIDIHSTMDMDPSKCTNILKKLDFFYKRY